MRKVLITAIIILSLLLAGLLGGIWYISSHIFVDDAAYAKNAQILDLREEKITESHYLAVQAQLPECRIIWNVPFQGSFVSSDVETLSVRSLTEEDIRILAAYFPKLTRIDANACQDYAKLEQLALAMPDCDVAYQVNLGSTASAWDTAELVLESGSYDFNILTENLIWLKKLESIHFPKAELTPEQYTALTEQHPDLKITATVEILGTEYDMQTTVLDLSSMLSQDVEAVAEKLVMLPELSEVQLMNGTSGSHLTLQDVQALSQAAPDVLFHYSFDFYGVTVSTLDEEVILKKLNVNAMPEGGIADELRAMLDVMGSCKRIVVEGLSQYDKIWQKISNEELAQLREEYRGKTNVVWRVYFGSNGSSLTDAEVLRVVYGLTDDNSSAMQYLEKVRYMDIGHNEFLDYCDFVSGMVSLEAVIVSGAPIKSLEPFRACKELKFLEMANCQYVPDLEPLKECTQLEMLNISYTKISDISPLEGLKLTHLNTIHNEVSEEAVQAYVDAHPDCWVVTEGNHYGVGWRYDTDEKTLLPWYAKLDAEYHYISQQNIRNNMGWYLPDEA